MAAPTATTLLLISSPPPLPKTLKAPKTPTLRPKPLSASLSSTTATSVLLRRGRRRDVSAAYGDDDDFGGGGADFDIDDFDRDDEDEMDNEKDYDVDYDQLLPPVKPPAAAAAADEEGDIAMVAAESFVSTQDWESETVVDYSINEEEFHKIRLLHCDFFIRRAPDPDGDVFDFREMYVTPPDNDVYAIPRVLAPLPQKYVRCTKKNFGRYNVTEPPVDAMRDPLYKSDREIMKVFLTKHYRNRRFSDPDFVLDFEEIYVIESKTKSITRAKVVVTIPEGKNRDRRNDLLLIRDGGNFFKIIDQSKRDDATTVLEREEWAKSRRDVEKHFRKFKDFDRSNWF